MAALVNTKGRNHKLQLIGPDHYRLSWCTSYKIKGSRLLHTRVITKDTDLKGAERFAKKWNVALPAPKQAELDL